MSKNNNRKNDRKRKDQLPAIRTQNRRGFGGRINGLELGATKLLQAAHGGGAGECPPLHKLALQQMSDPESFKAPKVVLGSTVAQYANTGVDTWVHGFYDCQPAKGELRQGSGAFDVTADSSGDWWVAVRSGGVPLNNTPGFIYTNSVVSGAGSVPDYTSGKTLAVTLDCVGYPDPNGAYVHNHNVANTLGVKLIMTGISTGVDNQGGVVAVGQTSGMASISGQTYELVSKHTDFLTMDATTFNANPTLVSAVPTIPFSANALYANSALSMTYQTPGGWLFMIGKGEPSVKYQFRVEQAHFWTGWSIPKVFPCTQRADVVACARSCLRDATAGSTAISFRTNEPDTPKGIVKKAEREAGKAEAETWSSSLMKLAVTAIPKALELLL